MKNLPIALALLTLLLPHDSDAATAREFAEAGLEVYRAYGSDQALRRWEYRPSRDDPAAKELGDLREAFGPISGFEILAEQLAGAHYSVVYALVRMERAPVFLRLTCYRSRAGWMVQEVVTRLQPFDFVPGFSTTGRVLAAPQRAETGSAAAPVSRVSASAGDTQSSMSE